MMKKERQLWLYVPCALVLACGILLGGCSEVRIRQQCLNLRTPTVEQQQGAYAEMVAHPELKNVRIQAADLDYALRENAACWGKKP
ncbi:hypothetical protein J3T99_05765 [Acetobacteraceae bacterium B3987]|nr:hypothetical protein [Acetobacteraceae bacterium B3987]